MKHNAVILTLVLIVSAVAGPIALGGYAAADSPDGMVGVPTDQITSDLPPNTPMGQAAQEIADAGVLSSSHADSLEVMVTSPGRAEQYTDGTVLGGGPIAIVVTDDQISEGRNIALPKDELADVLGGVPEAAYGTHEDGSEWMRQTEVVGDWVVVNVPHFSTNTITWSGDYVLEGTATDGSSYTYEQANTPSSFEINVTGDTNTEWDNVSASSVGNGDSVAVDVAGNADPTGPSTNGEPEVTFTGEGSTTSQSSTGGSNPGGTTSVNVGGNRQPTDGTVTLNLQRKDDFTNQNWDVKAGETATTSLDVSNLDTLDVISVTAETTYCDYYADLTLSVDGSEWGTARWDGCQVETNEFDGGQKNVSGTSSVSVEVYVSDYNHDSVNIYTSGSSSHGMTARGAAPPSSVTVTADGTDYTVADNDPTAVDLSLNSNSFTFGDSADTYDLDYTIDWTERTDTEDPAIDIDGDGTDEASVSGFLTDGEMATRELSNLSTSDDSATVSTTNSTTVGVDVAIVERTQTVDPTVEVNGQTTSYSGTLSDGTTATLTTDVAWIQEGTNRINVTVSQGVTSDAPAPQVDLYYTHEGTDETVVDYAAEKFSERYVVSKTFAGDRPSPTLEIPFAGDVVAMRNLEYRLNGGSWQTLTGYTLDQTTLNATLPSVTGGDSITVRANGTKVSVENADIQVTEPSLLTDDLDSRIDIASKSEGDVQIHFGDNARVRYGYDSTFTVDDYYRVDGSGASIIMPNAGQGDTLRVTSLPLQVAPQSNDVEVSVEDPSSTDPVFDVSPGDNEGDSVVFTLESAADGEDYVLYSQTNGIVRDSGTASSPLALEDDDSDEILQFQLDDSDSSSADSSGTLVVGQFEPESSNIPFVPIAIGGVVLLAGAVVIRRARSQRSSGGSSGGLSGRALALVPVGTLSWLWDMATKTRRRAAAIGGLGLLMLAGMGVIPVPRLPEELQIFIAIVAVPGIAFVLLKRTGYYEAPVWWGLTAVSAIVGLQILSGDVVELVVDSPAFMLLALGGLWLLRRAVNAWQAPEEKNVIKISGDGGG